MTSRNRQIFESARSKFGATGGIIAPSFLRSEVYLANGSQSYTFALRLLGNEVVTEHKLNEQDAFRITRVGLFLMTESVTVPGIAVRHTYPNPIAFPNEAGALQAAHLEHVYNGYLSAKVGDTSYLPDLPVFGCRVVNTAQQAAAGTGFGGTANSELTGDRDGFIDLEPQFDLKGRENNEIVLKVPGHSAQKVESVFGTTGYKAKLALILLGFKITGGGSVYPSATN